MTGLGARADRALGDPFIQPIERGRLGPVDVHQLRVFASVFSHGRRSLPAAHQAFLEHLVAPRSRGRRATS